MAKKTKFSILGDSISTLEGYSVPYYAAYYAGERKSACNVYIPEDTWWGQVIERLGGELLVNNSFSSSTVCCLTEYEIQSYACSDERTSSLDKNGIVPDVIMIFTGTNDWGHGIAPSADAGTDPKALVFGDSYTEMLKKLQKNYPDAELWCFTIPVSMQSLRTNTYSKRHFKYPVSEYCRQIRACARECGCRLIDIAGVINEFSTVDGFHPNKKGMKTIFDAVMQYVE